ncbi:polysaccharide biosynthesis/export family protein [Egbenema bharatensis]|uniref:polysaccharide biosynthesis/export family protein n=1 Tax=Egbenema bharatensis TaxID=3463334 RepID=UPI003A8A818E
MPTKGLSGLKQRATLPVLGLTLLTFLSNALPATAIQTLVAQTTAQSAPTSPPQSEQPYTLGAGDRVQIEIFQVPQYSGESDVLIDGTLNLPLVGSVSVAGLTLEQATATISSRYAQFLRRPVLTVTLINRRPMQLAISGEVTRPGSYAIQPDGAEFPTLAQLIEQAGGITQSADLRQVQVRRPRPGGGEDLISVNLWELLQTGNLQNNVRLRDGDTVIIPETIVDLAEAPIIAASSFAPEENRPINIAVVGEVFRPGAYTVTGGVGQVQDAGAIGGVARAESLPTVTRAIQVAGGIKPLADIRRVEVRRLTRTGEERSFEVDLWALLQGDLRQDAILSEGDTIIISRAETLDPAEATQVAAASFSPETIQVNVVGEVENPGALPLPPNSTLNQAVLAAGGFNTRARRSRVDLIRLNPDGSVTRQEVEIDFAEGLNTANNPLLLNNDVIIVGRSGLASAGDTLETILGPLGGVFSILELPFRFLRLFE